MTWRSWIAGVLTAMVLAGCNDAPTPPVIDLVLDVNPQTDPIFPLVGQTIRMQFQVANRSDIFSPGTTALLRVDGVDIGEFSVESLAGESARIGVTSFVIGSPGTHSVTLILDPGGVINDPDRGNNVEVLTVFVGLPSFG